MARTARTSFDGDGTPPGILAVERELSAQVNITEVVLPLHIEKPSSYGRVVHKIAPSMRCIPSDCQKNT
jgi:hypothetical protein